MAMMRKSEIVTLLEDVELQQASKMGEAGAQPRGSAERKAIVKIIHGLDGQIVALKQVLGTISIDD